MASPNNPKSSAELIRTHSAARYLTVNATPPPTGFTHCADNRALAVTARDALARQYR